MGGTAADIDVTALGLAFGSGAARLTALDDVSLRVQPGEFVSIVGESGCGKTTLLRAMAGLVAPTSGAVRIGGHEVDGPRPEVGFVFQKAVLLEWRRVLENVLLPVEIERGPVAAKRDAALDLLRMLGLDGFERRYPRQLSGGMQQRVCLARTLLMQPSVLLMDEPFGALDAITREQLNLELLRVWTRLRPTCVFVTHDIAEAVFLSDRVYLMTRRPGRVQRVFDISLPRPRTVDMLYGRELIDQAHEIRAMMRPSERDAA